MTTQDVTAMYSPLPAEAVDSARARAIAIDPWVFDRAEYPALPWSIEETVGTLWRNVHTGHLVTITTIGTTRPGAEPDAAGRPEPLYPSFCPDSVGFWSRGDRGDRFVIEHWVRVDHLPAAVQLTWYGLELAYHRSHIAEVLAKIARMDASPDRVACYHGNRAMALREITRARDKLDEAIVRMDAFARASGLVVMTDLRNTGVGQGAADAPAQLALF